ncbi:MAG: hypothetical protein H7255_14555 [Ramlibacter sp.]|nr:hypothetical protein [Ramlibacter sp.]
MTVETFTHINALNPALPAVDDPIPEGDDQIRGLKQVLVTDFPNIDSPVTATPAQLNGIGMVLLATATVVSASPAAVVDFASAITSAYEEYELHIIDALPVTSGVAPWVRTSTDGGATFAASSGDYDWMNNRSTGSSATVTNGGTTATKLELSIPGVPSVTGTGVCGVIRFYDPGNTTSNKRFDWRISYAGALPLGNQVTCVGSGARAAIADIDAIRFMFSSGSINSGKFKLYGVRK